MSDVPETPELRRLTKLKISPKTPNKVFVSYECPRPGGDLWDEFSMVCNDAPRPELRDALQALATDVTDICELPDSYRKGLAVTGVALSYGGDEGAMGAVLIAQKSLAGADAPLNLNTPHLPSAPYSEGSAPCLLPDETVERIEDLCLEAFRYVDGDRAQGDLFAGVRESIEALRPKAGSGIDSVTISHGDRSATLTPKDTGG